MSTKDAGTQVKTTPTKKPSKDATGSPKPSKKPSFLDRLRKPKKVNQKKDGGQNPGNPLRATESDPGIRGKKGNRESLEDRKQKLRDEDEERKQKLRDADKTKKQETEKSKLLIGCTGEFIGTFVHVLLGLGIECLCRVASTDSSLLEDYLPKLGWGLSWAVAFCIAGGISGGHFNGTVTLALCLAMYISPVRMLLYWLAQALAALMAGLIAYMIYYYPLDRRFGLDDTKHLFVGSAFGGAVRENVSTPFFWSLCASGLATFILVFAILFITDQENMHVPRPMYALLIGLLCYTPVLLITSFFYYGCVVINFPVDPVTRIFTLISWNNDYLNAMGGWIGCAAGAGFAVIIDFLVRRIRKRDDLQGPVGGTRKSDSRMSTQK